MVGLVVAFSLSSTLVKSAESPGVLVAFWRLAMVSVVWNVYLRLTGRRVTLRHVRQAFIPGVFFGVNLATFFVGATNNSVANAALIGSLSPFLIVPLGAKLFGEYNHPRALLFAVLAFGGTAMVLLNAPPNGDASLRGNVFGVLAMFLWVGYVVATRHFRRDMDVATFMATISPIAAVAVLPLAIANGDMFEMSARGWAYTLVLMLLTGVAAHGLLVFAQRTIQIGTIGIAQVAQPALAVVWSFLLLGETVRSRQVVGIAVVMGGLLGFLVLNERGGRARRAAATRRSGHRDERDIRSGGAARRSPGAPGTTALTACASVRSRSVMTWAAASMRRSAASQRARAVPPSPRAAAMCASASRAKTSTGASSVPRASSRIDSRRSSAPGTWSTASMAASRHSPSAACSPPPASRCQAVAASSDCSCLRDLAERPQDPTQVHPRQAASRTSPMVCALSIARRKVAEPVS